MAKEGVNVTICARGEASLRTTEKELLKKGVKVFAQTCDIEDTAQLDAFLDAAKSNLGAVDILVNNISALSLGEDYQDWQASINIDLLNSVKSTRKVAP